eukprot:TRINITY_DN5785_c0_g1_i1.p1 TRINITY_DN5785_c0_g1~~TRINITY_DN5785_c0_g1_i1.p1  ORF type:complete len:403 (-),score=108.75 TRINITY_DN5785_c0_g1_i1:138-1346(-)
MGYTFRLLATVAAVFISLATVSYYTSSRNPSTAAVAGHVLHAAQPNASAIHRDSPAVQHGDSDARSGANPNPDSDAAPTKADSDAQGFGASVGRPPLTCDQLVNASLTADWLPTTSSDLMARPPNAAANRSVAFCMSGGLRGFPDIHQQIFSSLVEPNGADAFAFLVVEASQLANTTRLLDSLPWIKAYQIEIHTPIEDRFHNVSDCGIGWKVENIRRNLQMFRHIYLCNELVHRYEAAHNIRYTTYIRSRPDLLLGYKKDEPFNLTLRLDCPAGLVCVHMAYRAHPYPPWMEPGKPNCSTSEASRTAGCPQCCGAVSDLFAVADREMMIKYAEVVHVFANWQRFIGSEEYVREHIVYWSLVQLGHFDKFSGDNFLPVFLFRTYGSAFRKRWVADERLESAD